MPGMVFKPRRARYLVSTLIAGNANKNKKIYQSAKRTPQFFTIHY